MLGVCRVGCRGRLLGAVFVFVGKGKGEHPLALTRRFWGRCVCCLMEGCMVGEMRQESSKHCRRCAVMSVGAGGPAVVRCL